MSTDHMRRRPWGRLARSGWISRNTSSRRTGRRRGLHWHRRVGDNRHELGHRCAGRGQPRGRRQQTRTRCLAPPAKHPLRADLPASRHRHDHRTRRRRLGHDPRLVLRRPAAAIKSRLTLDPAMPRPRAVLTVKHGTCSKLSASSTPTTATLTREGGPQSAAYGRPGAGRKSSRALDQIDQDRRTFPRGSERQANADGDEFRKIIGTGWNGT